VQKAAIFAQVSVALIYQWCGEGLAHYRFGSKGRRGKILIDLHDLSDFLESKKVTPAEDEDGWPA